MRIVNTVYALIVAVTLSCDDGETPTPAGGPDAVNAEMLLNDTTPPDVKVIVPHAGEVQLDARQSQRLIDDIRKGITSNQTVKIPPTSDSTSEVAWVYVLINGRWWELSADSLSTVDDDTLYRAWGQMSALEDIVAALEAEDDDQLQSTLDKLTAPDGQAGP